MVNSKQQKSSMVVYLTRELQNLRDEWPKLIRAEPLLPRFSWEDLKEELLQNAATPAQEMVVRGALSALLKMAPFKSPAHVLGEILMLASSVADLTAPHSQQGDLPMP